ncbi:phage portal protein [Bacillus paranthracis]|uniref:phage portal protein n=1 Tax=Bacillus cereus group TaxID=86661 RepID=UPI00202B9A00|nr:MULTISPECIES: phage portal protein [Bacillus cereus group]MDA1747723.1 phage portal protein [Bacillus cereus group sp. LD121LC]MDK7418672.1 phage portal protein [Bacillus paranthracis]MDK7430213.1 phage portal protein [Bacillus paranthracis]MDK7518980.1 phage portal protein [Bacillus paranthracis]MDK7571805.1 phage portal protein [Bacillus paranthracis]
MTSKYKVSVIKGASGVSNPVISQQQEDSKEKNAINGIIEPPYRIEDLQQIKENSTILGQCIDAYKRNIAGFGHEMQYKQNDVEETDEMKKEWSFVDTEIIPFFSFDKPFKEILEGAIDDRETTGNGYIEVIRNASNQPDQLANMLPQHMRVTRKDEELQDVKYIVNGKSITRKKKFRRYVQIVDNNPIYFKEFGDPRFLNKKTGKFSKESFGGDNATEILHLKIGNGPYGIPRWVSHVVHMVGARKAEELNLRYFKQGRHVPMAMIIKNGLLDDESEAALSEYATSIEGEENQHKFLLLQLKAGEDESTGEPVPADIELKSLADILQNDALFLEYDDKSRQKVQSAFRLPDIYVGYSRDFNRATADAAREITEEQVFEPERNSLEFIINNILLLPYELKHVYVNLRKPEISNTEDLVKMLDVLSKYGGTTFNDLREVAAKVLNKDLEPFEAEEASQPIALVLQAIKKASEQKTTESIQKSDTPADLVMIMKDVRDLLESMQDAED